MQIMKKVRPQSGTHLKSMKRYTLAGISSGKEKQKKGNKILSWKKKAVVTLAAVVIFLSLLALFVTRV